MNSMNRMLMIYLYYLGASAVALARHTLGFAAWDANMVRKTGYPVDDIRNCLAVMADWMAELFLCLNQSKTKILVVAPPAVRLEIIISGVTFDCFRLEFSAYRAFECNNLI